MDTWPVFLTEAKMIASTHFSPGVAGINRDGPHHEPISLLHSFRYNALFAWLHPERYKEVAVYKNRTV